MQALKNNVVTSLNKKAEFAMLDRLSETVNKKVDVEVLRQSLSNNK